MESMDSGYRPLIASWRFRLLLPMFAALLVGVMVGAYALSTPTVGPINVSFTASANVSASAVAARLQIARLVFATLAAAVVIIAYVGLSLMLARIDQMRRVVESLAAGQSGARTGMLGRDEISALGRAIDRYAEQVQQRQDSLRAMLRRQRRETEHLTAVLESLPDGIVVQDLDGRVIVMNDKARLLLGSQSLVEDGDVRKLTATVTDVIGPAIAPGLYALGDPKRVEHEGRMLSAQAAAVMSMSNQRVGTVVVLRDLTDEVKRERARDTLIDRLVADVHTPLSDMGRTVVSNPRPLNSFAREMTRHAVALQKLIVELRELTVNVDAKDMARGQRPLALDMLVHAIANEWRQVAQAANLKIEVRIEKAGMHVLGNEHRLRWAIGNIVDNAVKYTPPGGHILLEIGGEVRGRAYLRIKDTGVGITPEEQQHVFTRFYRGNPVTVGGRAIQVPGTGQGLSIAKQVIEAHGGNIRLKSEVGEGTTVFFSLPLTAPMTLEVPRIRDQIQEPTREQTARETESVAKPIAKPGSERTAEATRAASSSKG